MMTDVLLNWISRFRQDIEKSGFQLEWKSGYSGSSSVKIDNDIVVGSVAFWPENRFEFEFLSQKTGAQIFFAELELSTEYELHQAFLTIQSEHLQAM